MVDSWHWCETIKKGLSNDYGIVWERNDPKNIQPYERNLGWVTRAMLKFYPVDVVSSHDEKSRSHITEWLKMHEVNYNNLVLVADMTKNGKLLDVVTEQGSARQKAEKTSAYDIFIDDSPALYDKLRPDQFLFIFDQSWNRNIVILPDRSNFVRIQSLSEVLSYFAEWRVEK
jgi:hypothetical protein